MRRIFLVGMIATALLGSFWACAEEGEDKTQLPSLVEALQDDAAETMEPVPARREPFPSVVSFSSDDLGPLPQWQNVLVELERQKPQWQDCDEKNICSSLALLAWRSQIAALSGILPSRQLLETNRFINALPSIEGDRKPKRGEKWPSLSEMIEGRGGSLGRAIAKYISLREAGYDAQDLQITIGMDSVYGDQIALVTAYLDGHFVLLENLSSHLRDSTSPSTFLPYYSFNETTLWIHLPKIQESER